MWKVTAAADVVRALRTCEGSSLNVEVIGFFVLKPILLDLAMLCNGFAITFISEKHVVEDNVLFTNHLVGK